MGLYTGRGEIPTPKHYYTKIRDMRPSNLIGYWPQWEGGGAVSFDQSGNSRDGAYTGVTLGSEGIGDGQVCPFFDGANDYDDIYTAGLAGAFNGAEGTIVTWVKVFNVGVWTDGTSRYLLNLRADGQNTININKTTSNNQLQFLYRAGNVTEIVQSVYSDTAFFSVGLTWSKSADEVRAYINGAQTGATQSGLGVWAGALSATETAIGAFAITPNAVWHGYLAHCSIWNTPLTPDEIAHISRVK